MSPGPVPVVAAAAAAVVAAAAASAVAGRGGVVLMMLLLAAGSLNRSGHYFRSAERTAQLGHVRPLHCALPARGRAIGRRTSGRGAGFQYRRLSACGGFGTLLGSSP